MSSIRNACPCMSRPEHAPDHTRFPEWTYVTKPDGWEKEEDQDCWCGELWYANDTENHEDGEHFVNFF